MTSIHHPSLILLHKMLNGADDDTAALSVQLWQTIIDFQGHIFKTAGRSSHPGVEFSYSVKQCKTGSSTKAGRRYATSPDIEGYGNEIVISGDNRSGNQKTITRSSVDRALEKVLDLHKAGKSVTGPKKIGVFGASYIYPIFKEFGLIDTTDDYEQLQLFST